MFELGRIEEYRQKPVTPEFLEMMRRETNIPDVGEGLKVAKYLFLHSKRTDRQMTLGGHRAMNIEFGSVVGTRAKDYAPYLVGTLYPFELESQLYESLLEDQLSWYKRHEFKQILAHMIYFCDSLTDKMVEIICEVCRVHKIGYTLVEIAQFIKVNDIQMSETAL